MTVMWGGREEREVPRAGSGREAVYFKVRRSLKGGRAVKALVNVQPDGRFRVVIHERRQVSVPLANGGTCTGWRWRRVDVYEGQDASGQSLEAAAGAAVRFLFPEGA